MASKNINESPRTGFSVGTGGYNLAVALAPDGETPSPTSLSTGLYLGPLDGARFAPGRIFASRYRIGSLLGRGAMGEAPRGLVTFYTLFVLELSRRVHVSGSTPYPDEAFVVQALRDLANAIDGVLVDGCVLICDRDRKWSRGVLAFLEDEGVRIIQTPFRAPYCNAYAERFVRSIKEECLERMILFGKRHLRRTIAEFVAHYHAERNHQGIGNELIQSLERTDGPGRVRRRQRIRGMLNYYDRAAQASNRLRPSCRTLRAT